MAVGKTDNTLTDERHKFVDDNDGNVSVRIFGQISNALIPTAYDYIALTYVASGNGEGEVETAIYKTGGSGGMTIATLTLAYNSDDKISSVTRT